MEGKSRGSGKIGGLDNSKIEITNFTKCSGKPCSDGLLDPCLLNIPLKGTEMNIDTAIHMAVLAALEMLVRNSFILKLVSEVHVGLNEMLAVKPIVSNGFKMFFVLE